jgi:hypothetical protein
MSHDLRLMLDAIGYVTRYGIEWRALPVHFLYLESGLPSDQVRYGLTGS